MESGSSYQHVNNSDTAIIVHGIDENDPDHLLVTASWFHIKWGVVYETKEYLIKREDVNNWRRINSEKPN